MPGEVQPVAGAAAAPAPPPPPAATPAAVAPVVPAAPAAAPITPAAVAPVAVPAAEPAKPATEEKKEAAPATQPPVTEPPKVEPEKAKPAEADAEIKLPEGAKYDPEVLGEFKKFVKEKGVTKEQAEALLEFDKSLAQKHAAAEKARIETVTREARVKDVETLKADKEYGGAKYEQTVGSARRAMAISKHGEAFSKLLASAGLESHPDAVRFFADVRGLIAEDDTGSRAPGTNPPPNVVPQPQSQTARLAGVFGDPKANQKRK